MSNLYGPVFYRADTQAEFWVLPDWAHSAQAGADQGASLGISKRETTELPIGSDYARSHIRSSSCRITFLWHLTSEI